MKKRIISLLSAVVLIVLLTGCAEQITKGEVVDKAFPSAHAIIQHIAQNTRNWCYFRQ